MIAKTLIVVMSIYLFVGFLLFLATALLTLEEHVRTQKVLLSAPQASAVPDESGYDNSLLLHARGGLLMYVEWLFGRVLLVIGAMGVIAQLWVVIMRKAGKDLSLLRKLGWISLGVSALGYLARAGAALLLSS